MTAFLLPILLAGTLYLATLAPTINWNNAAEFAIAAMTLDVPHQPGYPLITRLGNLALSLPIEGEPAWRVNLVSAILGACSLGVFSAWLHGIGVPLLIAIGAAVWLGTGTIFWQMACEAEVYTLEILLLALSLLFLQTRRHHEPGLPSGIGLGLLVGMAVSHRPTLGVTVLLLVPILWPMSTLRQWLKSSSLAGISLGLLLGFAPLVDLYTRLQNPERRLIDPLIGKGFDGFWAFFTAADFRKAVGVFGPLELLARAKHWAWLVAQQGTPALLLLPILTLRRSSLPREAIALLWILVFNTGFILNYNAYDAQTMLMPSFFALAGLSALALSGYSGRRKTIVSLAFLLLINFSALANGYAREDPGRDCESFTYRLTAMLPMGSTLLVNDDLEFRPLLYLRLTRQFRPDLSLHLVDAFQEQDLINARDSFTRRPTYSTLIYPNTLAPLLLREYHLIPWGYAWRILPAHLTPTPTPDVRWGRQIAFSGSATLLLSQSLDILQHRLPEENATAPVLPGDVLQYQYQLASGGALADSLVVAPFIVADNGTLPSAKGVILGHDLHAVGTGYCPSSPAYQARSQTLYARRQIIVPDTLPPGRYEVRVLLGHSADLGHASLLLERLPHANLLGEEGETELFRLCYGFGLRPFISAKKAPNWNALLESGANWLNASNPIVLGEFTIPSGRP